MQFEGSRFYRPRAVAEALGVSPNTIYRAIKSGELEAFKHGTGKATLRISGASLNTYMKGAARSAREFVAGELAEGVQGKGSAGEVA